MCAQTRMHAHPATHGSLFPVARYLPYTTSWVECWGRLVSLWHDVDISGTVRCCAFICVRVCVLVWVCASRATYRVCYASMNLCMRPCLRVIKCDVWVCTFVCVSGSAKSARECVCLCVFVHRCAALVSVYLGNPVRAFLKAPKGKKKEMERKREAGGKRARPRWKEAK